jgi:hypothetical protein
VRVEFRSHGHAGTHRQLVQVRAYRFEVTHVGDGVAGKAVFPHGEIGVEPIGKAVLDEANRLLQGDGLRSQDELNVIRHHQVGVEFVMAQRAIVQQRVDEEIGHPRDLEDGAAIACGRGNKGHAGSGAVASLRHGAMLVGLKGSGKSHKWGALRERQKTGPPQSRLHS